MGSYHRILIDDFLNDYLPFGKVHGLYVIYTDIYTDILIIYTDIYTDILIIYTDIRLLGIIYTI